LHYPSRPGTPAVLVRWTVLAVLYKYIDDQNGYLAVLIAWVSHITSRIEAHPRYAPNIAACASAWNTNGTTTCCLVAQGFPGRGDRSSQQPCPRSQTLPADHGVVVRRSGGAGEAVRSDAVGTAGAIGEIPQRSIESEAAKPDAAPGPRCSLCGGSGLAK
jgi:hypothetical protein